MPSSGAGAKADPATTGMRQAIASIPIARLRRAGLLEALLRLAEQDGAETQLAAGDVTDAIDALDVESLIQRTLEDGPARRRLQTMEGDA